MVIALLIFGIVCMTAFSLYINRKEKRSARSWYSERLLFWRIEKNIFTPYDKPEEFLQKVAVTNEEPYKLPPGLTLICKVERQMLHGLDCVCLGDPEKKTKILYLHGGAYVEQPYLLHWHFLDRLVKMSDAQVIVPLYPKAPIHHYQESFDKLLLLYSDLVKDNEVQDLICMGDSAGGGLALSFSQLLSQHHMPQMKNLILLSPWLDVSMGNPSIQVLEKKDPLLQKDYLIAMARAWARDEDLYNPLLSPIFGNLRGLPKISLFIGTHELFLADARKFRALCLSRGVAIDYHEYPKMNHDFPLFPIPEAKRALQEIIEIIKSPYYQEVVDYL